MRNKFLLGIAAVALLVTAFAVIALAATPVNAKGGKGKGPKIAWSQARVKQVANPGETIQATVDFTPSLPISNATLTLTDSFSETVSVDPTNFVQLDAGTPYQVTVTFIAPAEGDRPSFNGVLHVRAGNRSYAKPLKLRFRVDLPDDGE